MRTLKCGFVLMWVSAFHSCLASPRVQTCVGDLRAAIPSVRVHAAVCLGRLADRSAVPALLKALKDPVPEVRWEAAKSLGALKDERAVSGLIGALRDKDKNVRTYAAYALGEIKDRRAAKALLAALHDPEWAVRDQAAWALRELHDPSIAEKAAAALRETNADVPHLLWLLENAGVDHALRPLLGLLTDGKPEVRRQAVTALGKFHSPETIPPLLTALKDPDPDVRCLAVVALTNRGDDRLDKPLRDLEKRERDPRVRAALDQAFRHLLREDKLMAYWSFNDRNAKIAKDETGRGSEGEIIGCSVVPGKSGAALEFGKGKYVELNKPAGITMGGKPLTVMAWVKTNAKNGVVVARGGAWCGFSLYVKDGLPKFGIHRVREGPTFIAAGKTPVPAGQWVHLAGVIKEDGLELYVNGKLAATTKTDGYLPGECGQGMEIGFDTANSPAEITDSFEGVIDEVRVYQAALTERDLARRVAAN